MSPRILPKHCFKQKGNHCAWFGIKIAQSKLKGIKTKDYVLTFSSRRETPRSHVLDFRTTSCHNVLYMRSDISKEMSRFRLPSWGRRRLLLKVPNNSDGPSPLGWYLIPLKWHSCILLLRNLMLTTSNILTSLRLVSKVIEKAVADPFTQHVQEHDLRGFAVRL